LAGADPDLKAERFYENTCHFGQFLPGAFAVALRLQQFGWVRQIAAHANSRCECRYPAVIGSVRPSPSGHPESSERGYRESAVKPIPPRDVFDEILNSPGVNDKQKAILTRVLGQLKEVVAKAPGQGNP